MVKQTALTEQGVEVGSWITLAHPAIAEIMSKAGFSWLAVDLEHSVITIREAEELIRVINLCGVTPYVRLTANDPNLIKRVMDAGAHGIIVPMVLTEEECQQAVAAVKYPPVGKRGVGLARAQGYGANFAEYLSWHKDNTKIIIQIEHIQAVENIDKLFQIEGVDGYILGPYDLSGSMGIPGQFDSPEFKAQIQKVHQAGERHNIPGGIHIIEPELTQLQQAIEAGNKFIAYSLDIRMLDVASRQCMDFLQQTCL